MNELIDILNSGNKEELKAFLNVYSKPIYERALALKGEKEEARACAKRTMAQIVRLAKQHRLSYDIDSQLMHLTDICCNDEAYERMLLNGIVDEVLLESEEEERYEAEQAETADAPTLTEAHVHTDVHVQTAPAQEEVFIQAELPKQKEAPIAQAPITSSTPTQSTQTPPIQSAPPKAPIVDFAQRSEEIHRSRAEKSAPPIEEVLAAASMEASAEIHAEPAPAATEQDELEYFRTSQETLKPKVEAIPAQDDDIFAEDDDSFSPAAQRRAAKEAKKREQEEKRIAAKEAKQAKKAARASKNEFYDLDDEDDDVVEGEDEGELLLFGEDEKKKRSKKPLRRKANKRSAVVGFDDDDDDNEHDDLDDDDEARGVSPGMVVLIFVLAVIVVLFVWILLVKLSTMGVISMSDFGFAEWFNQNIFKLY